MVSESINHKNFAMGKKELPVAIEVESVEEKPIPILDEKPVVVVEEKVEEKVFETTDVNRDGKTDLSDALEVVKKVWSRVPKKKKSKK